MDVLRHMKRKLKPTAAGAETMGIHHTRGGEIFVELKKGGNTEKLCEAGDQALEGQRMIEILTRPSVIKIRDLDESIT